MILPFFLIMMPPIPFSPLFVPLNLFKAAASEEGGWNRLFQMAQVPNRQFAKNLKAFRSTVLEKNSHISLKSQ